MNAAFKIKNILFIALLIKAVGIPGFVEFNRFVAYGEGDIDLINPYSIAVIILHCAFSFLVLLCFIFKRRKSRKQLWADNYLNIFLYFYILFLIMSFLFGNLSKTDSAIVLFRISEWLIFIFGLLFYIDLQSTTFVTYIHLLKWQFFLPLFYFVVALIFFPNLTFISSSDAFASQLGGYLYSPHQLAVLFSIIYFLTPVLFKNLLFNNIVSGILIVLLLLTYSRGAILVFAFTILIDKFFISNSKYKLFYLIIVVLIALYIIYSWSTIIFLASRGGSIQNLYTWNGRQYIWLASLALLVDTNFLGGGYILFSKINLPSYVTDIAGFVFPAVHAHNDLLQTLLVSGVLGGFIYLRGVLLIIKQIINIRAKISVNIFRFLICGFLLIVFSGATELVLSGSFNLIGAIFLTLCGYLSLINYELNTETKDRY